MAAVHRFLRKISHVLCIAALVFATFTPTYGTYYDCGNDATFPMSFAGCKSGYYYEDWENADSSLTPYDVGECIECPNGYTCPGGFLGPRMTGGSSEPYVYDGGGSMYDCGVGHFPMRFGGCKPGYYYEYWQYGEVSLNPDDDIGECLECPSGYSCPGGFAGPTQGSLCPVGYYDDDDDCTACTNKPAHSTYTGNAQTNNCPWVCDAGYGLSNGSCVACSANEIGVGGTCQPEKFSVTTTSNTDAFGFYMSAKGTFYIDWGDGTIQTISRTNNTDYTKYEHEYASSGTYTVRFGGTATGYNEDGYPVITFNEGDACWDECDLDYSGNIASISGVLSALFPMFGTDDDEHPRFDSTFAGATHLTQIPAGLFSGITTGAESMFFSTFYGCTGLTSIPAGLFSGITAGAQFMFSNTFNGCTGLQSIPATLFSGITTGAYAMFINTFQGCTGLQSIPAGLFSGITAGAGYMFSNTFKGCTGLTSVPAGLFSGITTGANNMFSSTFYGCTGLQSIPANLFSGITTPAQSMFSNTFGDCTGLQSIPAGLFSGITTGANSMFSYTFDGCTELQSIPAGLFSGITTGGSNMFANTFANCTNLAGYIPPTTFAGLIANGHPTASYMWNNTFNNTQLVTSCPSGTQQYITGYEGSTNSTTWNGKVSCGCAAGTYGDGVNCTACANSKPANSSWTGGATTPTCAWTCNAGYVGNGTECVAPTFSITTTNLSANTEFSFKMSAIGTFRVNWGDGSEQVITRTNTTETTYSHTYATAGTYIIGFNGTATGYSTDASTAAIAFNTGNQTKIASVSGNLSAMFPYLPSNASNGAQPRFYMSFNSATNLTTVPDTLFANYTTGSVSMFAYTFGGCTGLTSIPAGLFSGITTGAQSMFNGTFGGCTGLQSIPAGLFSGITTGGSNMFANTFYGCTGLQSIPAGLFSGITTGAGNMFINTFNGCTGLTSIPAGLFSGITTGANSMFSNTFNGCTNLAGYIPPTTFAGLIANGHPTASNMWNNTFNNTGLVTSCPSGTQQYITGYEGSTNGTTWNGKVSCGCESGYWGDGTTCTACANSIPQNSSYSGVATTATCPWVCDAGYTESNGSCVACSANEIGVGGTCQPEKFSITTTSNTDAFGFYLSAAGTFWIDWGDGTVEIIDRTDDTDYTKYEHEYASSGTYTVRFGGTATGYNDDDNEDYPTITFNEEDACWDECDFNYAPNIASISGSLGALFPKFGNSGGQYPVFATTFSTATHLTSIPAGLFSGITTGAPNMFYNTFSGCTGLTSIPAELFSNITTGAEDMFRSTFYGCTGLQSIPAGLFSGITTGANSMFSYTFTGCTGLTSIPSGLFSGITTGAQNMFAATFSGCTGLQSIPAGLFSGITTGAQSMFYSTFSDCTGLTSIPAGLFSGITTGAERMFQSTFFYCTGLTSIPAGLFSGITTGAERMFIDTFGGCTNLAGYIPPTTFAGLIANGHPTASKMWSNTFNNTQLVTSCPANTQQYITGYEGSASDTTWNGKVSCGTSTCENGYYENNGTCTACTNTKPANSSYSGNAMTNACPWACNAGTIDTGTSCETEKFSITTTSTDSFQFKMTATGTFYVDCGDGGTLTQDTDSYGTISGNTVTRTSTNTTTYTCTWDNADTHTIKFSGTATGYNTSSHIVAISFNVNDSTAKIASISGNLSAMFPYISGNAAYGAQPRFGSTFSNATNLTSVPDTLFANYTTGADYMFSSTFAGTGLTSIPAGLFNRITTGAKSMFSSTFYGCTGLTSIPSGLFSGITTGAEYMFSQTFLGCTGLQSIPAGLFSGITTGASGMFHNTFLGCTGLTSIPSGLFSGITTGAEKMFDNTFSDCTGLTSIPAGLFSGITTGAQNMFLRTFGGCTGLQSIPAGLFSGITTGANYMFSSTFLGCTGLQSIPAGLFSGITTGAERMFQLTFRDCTNLAGYIPPTTFAGLIANGHPTATNMWLETFNNTQLVTSCPSGTTQYITGYEGSDSTTTWNGKVSCGCETGYWGDGTTCTACANSIPQHSSYSGIATTATCPWACDAGYVSNGTECVAPTFSVTTTNLSANDTFSFKMSATGTFHVNWGDGTEETITRTDTTVTTYSHTYAAAGTYTIGFNGTATGYSTNIYTAVISFNTGTTQAKIASLSGNLSAMFPYLPANPSSGAQPRFYLTFSNAINLTSVPATLFSNYTTGATFMFQHTFSGCKGLQSIPAGLFSGITITAASMFYDTFTSCTGLTSIPAGLFSGITTGAEDMFFGTFDSCTGLQSIPAGLFSGVTTGASSMFTNTFKGCTGLRSVPSDLFSNITTVANNMFDYTFWDSTNLTGYIPPTTFAGLIANDTTKTTNMWSNTFKNTQLVTSCPSGTQQYITGYEGSGNTTWNGKVSCGCETGYWGDGTTCTACANSIPQHSSYSGIATTATCPWACDAGYVSNGTECVAPTFSVTTTNLSANDTFSFKMSATGTFHVNWGDGTEETITRTDTTVTTYSHTYTTAGTYTIGFNGMATGYSTNTDIATISFNVNNSTAKIASVSGNLSAMFPYRTGYASNGVQPRFYNTFYGATNLTSVPDTLFANYTTGASGMFQHTFSGCTGLQSIPAGLFSGITTGAESIFERTFSRCAGLQSIPADLFSGITTGEYHMFFVTFGDCTGLTSIPAGLFSGITTGAEEAFRDTFNGCTGLQSIPAGLFSGITTGATGMFYQMFAGCTNLAGYIPPTTFAGLIANGHPTASYMWGNTFNNTQLVTSCPAGTQQYITGYEGSNASTTWNGKVSCGCETGYWGDGTTCTACANSIPQHSSYSGVATTATCPWACDSGYFNVNDTSCEAEKFSVTTTSGTNAFGFYLSAAGTFWIDWGDGTVQTLSRTNNTDYTKYEHEYGSAGTYTVRFGGTATGYNNEDGYPAITFNEEYACYDECDLNYAGNIASISGSLGALFPKLGNNSGQSPRFESTFAEATNLTSIPAGLFSGITTGAPSMFGDTFNGCTGLTSIPAGLFSGITTGASGMFRGTFIGCTGLQSIPAGLFSGITTGANSMFSNTFSGCTGLQSIPAGLFSGITTGAEYMFNSTFAGTGLTSIPAGLFSGITTGASSMFSGTFRGCTGLQSIPAGLFSGITTGASSMFNNTFNGCTGLTSIPAWLFSGITTGASQMFYQTFLGCTNLAGYIPPTTFAGLIANGHPTASDMWYYTFNYTGLVTSCPSGTTQYITGYEGSASGTTWNGKVSCGCESGYWGDGTTCTACANKPANSSYSGVATTATCPWTCDNGYHADNDMCAGNVINITWSNASAEDITANNAGTATYGGDIRTPRAATPVTGKTFKGWRFSVPSAQPEQP